MLTPEIVDLMLALRQDSGGEWPKYEEGPKPYDLIETLKKIIQKPGVLRSLTIWSGGNPMRCPTNTEDAFTQLNEGWQERGPEVARPALPNIDVDSPRAQGG